VHGPSSARANRRPVFLGDGDFSFHYGRYPVNNLVVFLNANIDRVVNSLSGCAGCRAHSKSGASTAPSDANTDIALASPAI
jgi:hypothetical protein